MTIVAPVDRSERADRVIREAETLAEAFDEPVHVIHVLSRSEFRQLESESVEETGEPIDMNEVREFATAVAEEAAEGLSVPHESFGMMGDADRIVDHAEEHDARYIVVGPRKRSPIGKAVFGDTSQSILLNAPCPVVSTIEQ